MPRSPGASQLAEVVSQDEEADGDQSGCDEHREIREHDDRARDDGEQDRQVKQQAQEAPAHERLDGDVAGHDHEETDPPLPGVRDEQPREQQDRKGHADRGPHVEDAATADLGRVLRVDDEAQVGAGVALVPGGDASEFGLAIVDRRSDAVRLRMPGSVPPPP